jgi:SAM-dependent methyltransferase
MLRQLGEQLSGGHCHSPAAEQNKGPILEVLERFIPRAGLILEIASGTGQHVLYFAEKLPALTWQPSEPDVELRESIAPKITEANLHNVKAPLALDVSCSPWPVDRADAVVCINMIHIAPWGATKALFEGAGRILSRGGVLFLYGPYRRFGHHTAPSNAMFDQDLRRRNPDWGLRDLEDVTRLAEDRGFGLAELVPMPVNNFSVIFRKSDAPPAVE